MGSFKDWFYAMSDIKTKLSFVINQEKVYEQPLWFASFIKYALGGELRFSAADFPDQSHLLKVTGAEFIVLGIDIAKGKDILTIDLPLNIKKINLMSL